MKTAAAAGRIETFDSAVKDGTPFGLRIVVHATGQGPRSATAVSENVIDGTAAFPVHRERHLHPDLAV